jgi:hypothetical protein
MKTLISVLAITGVLCATTAALAADAGASEKTPTATATATAKEPAKAVTEPVAAPTEAPAEPKPAEVVEEDPIGSVMTLINHIRAGEWRLAAAIGLALLMFALARVRDKIKWFKGDRGGAVLVMVLALAGTLSAALASDAALDWRLLAGALGLAWTAVGGVQWGKRIIWPKDDEDGNGG